MLHRPEVEEAIAMHQAKLRALAELSEQEVLSRLDKIARFDVRKLFDKRGRIIRPDKLDPDTALVVASIEQEVGPDGIVKTRVRIPDRLTALVSLGKHFGTFEPDNRQKTPNVLAMILASVDRGKVDLRPAAGAPRAALDLKIQPPQQPEQPGMALLDTLGNCEEP
jgi:hypothetical protein